MAGPPAGKHAPMDFGRFQVCVDFLLDAQQLTGGLQIVETSS